jgi:hypothetical protein
LPVTHSTTLYNGSKKHFVFVFENETVVFSGIPLRVGLFVAIFLRQKGFSLQSLMRQFGTQTFVLV